MFWLPVLSMGCGTNNADSPSRGESVTGTFLEPETPSSPEGFTAIDEECGHTDDPLYMNRFVTSMFRDAVAVNDRLYLVDGSFLWTIDITNLNQPVRTSLLRLPGQPISITAKESHTLWIAAGDAGILRVDIGAPDAPTLVEQISVNGTTMDVTYKNNLLYAVSGYGGFHLFTVDEDSNALAPLSHLTLRGFPNGIDVAENIAFVSACGSLVLIDIEVPFSPQMIGQYDVETGHARDVTVQRNHAYVSAGEALYAFDVSVPGQVQSKGYYTDLTAEGFYVNGTEVHGETVYIAAGDESVRAVNISQLLQQTGSPAKETSATDGDLILDGPFEFDEIQINDGFTNRQVVSGDPINVVLQDNTLFVLGNFRWMGERLIRIFSIEEEGTLLLQGEYEQPRASLFLAANRFRSLLQTDQNEIHLTSPATAPPAETVQETIPFAVPLVDVVFHDTRTIVVDEQGNGYAYTPESLLSPFGTAFWISAIEMLDDGTPVIADTLRNGIFMLHANGSNTQVPSGENTFFGYSRLLARGDRIFAYDPYTGMLLRYPVASPDTASRIYAGLCENFRLDDFYSGANESAAQMATQPDTVYLLCPSNVADLSTVLAFADSSEMNLIEEIPLPAGMYRSIVATDNDIFVLRTDNNRYTFTIVRINHAGQQMETSADGFATHLALQNSTLLVGDNDRGLRYFDIPESGGVVERVEESDATEEVTP